MLPSWQNGQKYRVVHWVGEPTSIVKYHTKVDEKGVKKRHKISIPAVWVSHLEKGEAKLIRENVVDYEMVEVRQKWPTLDTQGNEVYVISNLRIMEQKTCIRCKQTKPITEFGRLKSTEDGMNPRCKSCLREYANQAYSKRKSTLPARRGGAIHNPDLAGYTDRKLLEELKARGFVWSDMKRIQPVKYDSI